MSPTIGRMADGPETISSTAPAGAIPFDHSVDFEPAGDFEAFARTVPARWAVYLLSDAEGRPVQLLCVKNLRYSLRRRLGRDDVDAGP